MSQVSQSNCGKDKDALPSRQKLDELQYYIIKYKFKKNNKHIFKWLLVKTHKFFC